jgi:hypothetical protein
MAAGSAADTETVSFIYEAFSGSSATASGGGALSAEQEFLLELAVLTAAILTGTATNFAGIRITHRNAAGTIVNQIRVDFLAAGVVTVAFAPMNFGPPVVSGGVVPGSGTGVLTVAAGTVLPWALSNGDTITLDRLSNNATGLATPNIAALGKIGVKS